MNGQGNNKYRVTFFSVNGIEQNTVITGRGLSDIITKVESIIADPKGYFVNDSKNNCYFKVIKENISYIQYELLFSDKELTVEKIKELAPAVVRTLTEDIRDEELYALALYDFDIETKEFLLNNMDILLQIKVLKEGEKLFHVSPADTYQAQEILIDKLILILKEME